MIMKLMHPHLDGELDVKESLRVQAHLEACSPCREAFVAEKEFLDLFRAQLTPPPPAPSSIRQRVAASGRRTGHDAPTDDTRA